MTAVKLIWITPDAERVIAYCARVSNPANQDNPDATKLLRYCIRNSHWSVFEMAGMCVEINMTRDIGRQILRHRSFHFQEFSGRYQSYDALPGAPLRECRLQDTKNRQNSIPVDDEELKEWWDAAQYRLRSEAHYLYEAALRRGIAKEQARALLPEGLTPSRMYMHGTIRDWLHYVDLRSGNGTQKEHMEIAKAIGDILRQQVPTIHAAMWGSNGGDLAA